VDRTLRASPLCRQLGCGLPTAIINNLFEAPTWCQLESIEYLFGIAVSGMKLEPRSCSPEWALASKIRNGRQVSALNIRRLLHPTRIVSNVLYHLRPVACQLWGEALGFIFHVPVPNVGQMSKSAYRTRAELETAGFPGKTRTPRCSDSDPMQ
jgi:hypothetical protein